MLLFTVANPTRNDAHWASELSDNIKKACFNIYNHCYFSYKSVKSEAPFRSLLTGVCAGNVSYILCMSPRVPLVMYFSVAVQHKNGRETENT